MDELLRKLNEIADAFHEESYPALERACREVGSAFKDCRNELCEKCGLYEEAHLGACDGCRWKI